MPHYRKLIGQRCYLSPCAPEDAELWARWETDLRVAIPLGDEAYTVSTPRKAQDWIEQASHAQEPVFTIVTTEGDVPIGRCLLFAVNPVDRSAMLGILIGEAEYRGQGYGTEALRLLLDYAFNLLNLHSVMLGTFDFNAAAQRCYQKVGFREIGRRRQARCIAGRYYDAILMDLLADEFTSPMVGAMLPVGQLPPND
jgi:RimJ/RimL family protein N-acetyltransferase